MKRHQVNPIERDQYGEWDGVVKWTHTLGCFIRFTDRDGEIFQVVEPRGELIR